MTENLKLFDSHLHIIDPKFPLYSNQGYLPEPFTTGNYLENLSQYNLCGGAVVSGSFQKQDQNYLISALSILGDRFVGVTQLLPNTPDTDILKLNSLGVRAVRINLKRGGSEKISELENFANRIYELAKWHIELYIDSTELDSLFKTLLDLPAISIDHLGLSKAGFTKLLKLAEHGAKVKACGFGRINFAPDKAMLDLYSANPDCLLFGTDLPSTRAKRPYQHSDYELVLNTFDDKAAAKVLFENAYNFYHRKLL